MAGSRLTTKGQVTIPKEVRAKLGLKPGDSVEFVEEKGGVFRIKKTVDIEAFKAVLEKWRGAFEGFDGMTTDEIMDEMRGPRLSPEEIEELSRDREAALRAEASLVH